MTWRRMGIGGITIASIRRIDIPDPAYTYCANRFMTPDHEPYALPVGPVLVSNNPFRGVAGREVWIPSPDTEEIRRYLLEMVRDPTRGYGSYANPFPMEVFVRPYMSAATQLVQWRDRRVIGALEELIKHPAFQDRRYDDRRNSVRAFLDDVRVYLAIRDAAPERCLPKVGDVRKPERAADGAGIGVGCSQHGQPCLVRRGGGRRPWSSLDTTLCTG